MIYLLGTWSPDMFNLPATIQVTEISPTILKHINFQSRIGTDTTALMVSRYLGFEDNAIKQDRRAICLQQGDGIIYAKMINKRNITTTRTISQATALKPGEDYEYQFYMMEVKE